MNLSLSDKKGRGYGKTKEERIAKINSYRNPDSRCTYPFTCDPLGYCWSFAHHVDGTEGYEDMEKICPRCDLWEAPKKDRA
jgi:hypothetical protein